MGHQTVVQLDLAGAGVGFGPCALAQADQCAWVFATRAEDAPGAVIFETAPHHPDAIGQQGRGKSVTVIAMIRAAIEAKCQGPVPVNAAAAGQARAHDGPSALISWFLTSRRTRTNCRQP